MPLLPDRCELILGAPITSYFADWQRIGNFQVILDTGPCQVCYLLPTNFTCHSLEALAVTRPPFFVDRRHVVVSLAEPDTAVDKFPNDVGMSSVPMGLGDHVVQDLTQRHLSPIFRSPGHPASRVQRQRRDRLVRVFPDPPVETNDLVARFISSRPHVRVRLGVICVPRQRLLEGPTEALAEVARLDAGHMFDQPQQVGPDGSEGSAAVVLGESVELPQEGVSSDLQVPAQV
jgi:hypothetical protein